MQVIYFLKFLKSLAGLQQPAFFKNNCIRKKPAETNPQALRYDFFRLLIDFFLCRGQSIFQ